MKRKTQLIHGGISNDPATGAVTFPIYQVSTYKQEGVGGHKGYEYSRTGNPTRHALEELIKELEGGKAGFAFGSGMAAMTAVMMLFNSGDHVILTDDVYGGSFRVMTKVLNRLGIDSTFVDTSKPENILTAIKPNTKAIHLETPTNPLLKITDIEAVAKLAKEHNLLTIVDNTFSTPYWQNPLELGADIVVHSATKYLGGHSDVIQGCLMMNDQKLRDDLYFIQKSCGAVPGPQDCFLVLRGIKTLHLRMQRHCENGRAIAHYLKNHPKVKTVYWCGFEDHPGYAVAKKQMRDFGGMMSFELKDESIEATNKVLSSTHLFALAESLGGVESLINHPATMTHASIPREERIKNGLSDSLIRLSVGVEDVDDLIADLGNAIG